MPKRTRAAALLAPLLLLALCAAEPAEWTSPDRQFKVRFPGTPKESELKTRNRPVKVYSVEGGKFACKVMVTEMPELANATDEKREKALDAARDALLKSLDGKLVSEKTIRLGDKHPGRELLIETPATKLHWRWRAYCTPGYFYEVVVAGRSADAVKSREAEAFLDSFRLAE
jgi:hypothetical protein